MIQIAEDKIDPENALKVFREGLIKTGAIASFTGIVRDDGQTDTLELSHYPGFTEKHIQSFCDEAEKRWPLDDVLVIHRVGSMAVGDPIVVVAAASAHRRAAFEACDFLMDKLKCEAPFWKQETSNGKPRWIEPRSDDRQDLDRWS